MLEVAHHHRRPTMHAPCMPRLTLGHIRRDSLTDMNPSTTRTATLPDVDQHRPRCTAAARRSEGSAVATEKAATAHHRGRPRCSDKHSGHSGAMPAATVDWPRRSAACSGRPQRWGRGYGPLGRYTTRMRTGSDNTCNVNKRYLVSPPRAGPRHPSDPVARKEASE